MITFNKHFLSKRYWWFFLEAHRAETHLHEGSIPSWCQAHSYLGKWDLNLLLRENRFVDTVSPFEQTDSQRWKTHVVSCRSGGFDKLLTSSLGLLLQQSHLTGCASAWERQTHIWNSPPPLNSALSATQHSHINEPPHTGRRTLFILFTG